MAALLPLPPESDGVYRRISAFLAEASLADLLREAEALSSMLPELAPTIGFDQRSPHHAYDLYTHIAHVTAALPSDLPLRWAGLLHDIGKIPAFRLDASGRGHFKDHARLGAPIADGILQRIGAPDALRAQAVWLTRYHMTRLGPDPETLRLALQLYGAERLEQLLLLQEADMHGKGTSEHAGDQRYLRLRRLLAELSA